MLSTAIFLAFIALCSHWMYSCNVICLGFWKDAFVREIHPNLVCIAYTMLILLMYMPICNKWIFSFVFYADIEGRKWTFKSNLVRYENDLPRYDLVNFIYSYLLDLSCTISALISQHFLQQNTAGQMIRALVVFAIRKSCTWSVLVSRQRLSLRLVWDSAFDLLKGQYFKLRTVGILNLLPSSN